MRDTRAVAGASNGIGLYRQSADCVFRVSEFDAAGVDRAVGASDMVDCEVAWIVGSDDPLGIVHLSLDTTASQLATDASTATHAWDGCRVDRPYVDNRGGVALQNPICVIEPTSCVGLCHRARLIAMRSPVESHETRCAKAWQIDLPSAFAGKT